MVLCYGIAKKSFRIVDSHHRLVHRCACIIITRPSDHAESSSTRLFLIFGSGCRNCFSKMISSCLGSFSLGNRMRCSIAFGSKIDTGEWAYNLAETLQLLWDTTKESALTFNVPSTVHNVSTQNHNSIAQNSVATASPTFANSKDRLYQNSKKIEPIEGYLAFEILSSLCYNYD